MCDVNPFVPLTSTSLADIISRSHTAMNFLSSIVWRVSWKVYASHLDTGLHYNPIDVCQITNSLLPIQLKFASIQFQTRIHTLFCGQSDSWLSLIFEANLYKWCTMCDVCHVLGHHGQATCVCVCVCVSSALSLMSPTVSPALHPSLSLFAMCVFVWVIFNQCLAMKHLGRPSKCQQYIWAVCIVCSGPLYNIVVPCIR